MEANQSNMVRQLHSVELHLALLMTAYERNLACHVSPAWNALSAPCSNRVPRTKMSTFGQMLAAFVGRLHIGNVRIQEDTRLQPLHRMLLSLLCLSTIGSTVWTRGSRFRRSARKTQEPTEQNTRSCTTPHRSVIGHACSSICEFAWSMGVSFLSGFLFAWFLKKETERTHTILG